MIRIQYIEPILHSEETLIQACINEEAQAQRLLYEQHASRLMGICYRYAKNEADAEDILQIAFIKIFDKLKHFRKESSLETWMTRIVINTAISHLRITKKFSQESDIESVENQMSFSQEQYHQIDTRFLMKCIQELPDGYRVVLNMFAIEGYSHKEISEQLNINESTSRSHYFRAKALLEKKLRSAYPDIKSSERAG